MEQVLFSACVVSNSSLASLVLNLGDYCNRKSERSSENKTRREEATLYPEKNIYIKLNTHEVRFKF